MILSKLEIKKNFLSLKYSFNAIENMKKLKEILLILMKKILILKG